MPTSSSGRPRHRGRGTLLAGVAAACVLGVGLGLWAKPQIQERRAAAVRPADVAEAPPATAHKLQIVVDGRPALPSGPSAVLPAAAPARPPAPILAIPVPSIEPRAPARPLEGLIRAQAVSPPTAPPEPDRLARALRARAQVAKAEAARAEAAKVRLAEAKAARAELAKAQLAKAQLAKAQIAKAHAARIQLAKAEAAQVQAHKAAAHRLELAQRAREKAAEKAQARAEKAEQVRLAQAEAKGRAEAREEARQEALDDARKRARLAALAHTLARAVQHRAPPPVEEAKLERPGHKVREAAHAPRVEQASLKQRRGHAAPRLAAAHPARAHPELLAPQPATGLVRVSTTPHCANRDPGEAVVCADPSLGAAERQLTRAYQVARAAGVPDAQLRSQQQRWLAARSAAAREAPWAVRDVYMARIAELNGQAKDAQEGY